jgi:hypothetical protein
LTVRIVRVGAPLCYGVCRCVRENAQRASVVDILSHSVVVVGAAVQALTERRVGVARTVRIVRVGAPLCYGVCRCVRENARRAAVVELSRDWSFGNSIG